LSQIAYADVDLASAQLRDVENYLRPRLRAFMEAGLALMAIRERRLYIQAGFDSFDGYCRERWGVEAGYARRMCDAAQVAAITSSTDAPAGVVVENEAQARELAPLLGRPEELRAVWQKVAERADQAGQPVTAAAIRTVRREHEQANPAPPRNNTAPPRPVPQPVTVIPAEAHRTFLMLTQAAEEVRALGGPAVLKGKNIPGSVLREWADAFDKAAALCTELAGACRDELG
jgi:hypothetical protein